jgi:plasmid stability protein
MSAVTLKNVPRALHRTLKARAQGNHRSLNREILATLEASVTPRIRPVEEWLQEAANLRSRLNFKASEEELNVHKRAGRA